MAAKGLSHRPRARSRALFCFGIAVCLPVLNSAGEAPAPGGSTAKPASLLSASALIPGSAIGTPPRTEALPQRRLPSDSPIASVTGLDASDNHGLTGVPIAPTNGLEGITISLEDQKRLLATERIRFDAMNTKDGLLAPDVVRAARQMRLAGRPSAWGGLAANRPKGLLQAFNIFAPYPEDGPGNGLPASEGSLYDRPTPRIERDPLTHEANGSILTFSCDR